MNESMKCGKQYEWVETYGGIILLLDEVWIFVIGDGR